MKNRIVFLWCMLGRLVGSCEPWKKPLGPIKGREFRDWFSDCFVFQEVLCSMELILHVQHQMYLSNLALLETKL